MFDLRGVPDVPAGDGAAGPSSGPAGRVGSGGGVAAPAGVGVSVPAGTGLAALAELDGVELTGRTGRELLEVLQAWDRQACWLAARTHRVMAAVTGQLLREFPDRPVGPDGWSAGGPDYSLMIAEVAAATRQSEGQVGSRWVVAERLTGVLTETLAALEAGRVGEYQARLIAEETSELSVPDARRVEAAVLPKAGGRTPAQVRRSLRTAVLRVDPGAADRRAKRAVKERGVWTRSLPDGMAEFGATGPAAAIHAMFNVLDVRAERPRPAGDTRLIGARRFDILLATLTGAAATGFTPAGAAPTGFTPTGGAATGVTPTGGAATVAAATGFTPTGGAATGGAATGGAATGGAAGSRSFAARVDPAGTAGPDGLGGMDPPGSARPDARPDLLPDVVRDGAAGGAARGPGFLGDGGPPISAVVHVTMDLPTLLGLQDNPARLAGYGPLPAALARDLAASNPWRRLITEPLTGHLLDAGRRSYRPSAALAEFIRARDTTCLFPGCTRSPYTADLDHRIRYTDGGPTDRANLRPLCTRHHRLRHRGWTYQLLRNGRDTTTGALHDPHAANDPYDTHTILWTSPTGRTYQAHPDSDDNTQPLTPPPHLHPHDQHDWSGECD